MKNYESPTIEQAGGIGNEIEPQFNVLLAVTDVGLYLELYLTAVVYTTAFLVIVAGVAAVFTKTAGVSN
ncbi:hypothetical protein [Caldisericum sp.]|jgi:hypothetical protein|uniref:hypothetical protein n=2 Tax=Caldisericum sp. TaxID=2499687 RepID=UPI003D104A25